MDFVHVSETLAQKQCVKCKEMRMWEGIQMKSDIEHSISQLTWNDTAKFNNSQSLAFENMTQ